MGETFGIYAGFAGVYDIFMDNVSYDEWFFYLHRLMKKSGVDRGTVVELACGTGEITKRLADAGYEVIGTDLSEEMLMIAREKCPDDVLFIHQDMRTLELLHEADAFVCIGDGMNYLESIEEVEKVLAGVHRYLKEDGLFLFDMKTDYFFREVVGNRTITENRENASYIWENSYDEERLRNEYLLTTYELVDDDRDLFVRSDEIHYQQVFLLDEVVEVIKKTGFSLEYVYEAFSEKKPEEDSERIYLCARNCA